MNGQKHRLEELFQGALELDSPHKRASFLDRMCAGEPALRAEVEELLAAAEAAEAVFQPREPAHGPERAGPGEPVRERPGSVIGRYKLLEQIGEGGMGVVYMAEQQEPVRRRVALKIIKLGMDTRQVIARFEAERQALALTDNSTLDPDQRLMKTTDRNEIPPAPLPRTTDLFPNRLQRRVPDFSPQIHSGFIIQPLQQRSR